MVRDDESILSVLWSQLMQTWTKHDRIDSNILQGEKVMRLGVLDLKRSLVFPGAQTVVVLSFNPN